MPKKKIIKSVFESEFNAKIMRNQILKKMEMKENNCIKILKYTLPVCLIAVICGVLVLNNNHNILKESEKASSDIKNIITINKLDNVGEKRLDAITKGIAANDSVYTWLDKLREETVIPKDLDKFNYYGIFTREAKTGEFTILNCYVYEYFNEKGRNIRVSFSANNKPIRDYYFDEVGEVSRINDIELKIYQHEESYYTEFKYNNYNFDIETNNINIEELIDVLETIFK